MLERIAQWIRPEIRAINAYSIHAATGLIKLDAMENPYTWPESLRQEWAKRIESVAVNRYPDPEAIGLKMQLRQAMQIPDTIELLLGNGSDELIQIILLTLGGAERVLLSIEPSFVMYKMMATWTSTKYVGVPLLSPDFALNTQAILEAIKLHNPAVIFLAYPNNPTGNLFETTAIHEIIQATNGLVIIDEAYAPFTDASFQNAILEYDNLLVLRTLSKMGLAGLRLGFLMGHPQWIRELNKVRMPYNINVLTQMTAEFALGNKQLFDHQTQQIRSERERMRQRLITLSNITAYPSQANFILLQVPQASNVFDYIKAQGILIKNLHNTHSLLTNCLRVTIGTPEENTAFFAALERGCQSKL